MRKQKVILNKFERMLLESKFPTLKILLEKDEGLDDLFGDVSGGENKDSGSTDEKSKDTNSDKGGGDDGGLGDLFGDAAEGGEAAEGGDSGGDEAAEEDKGDSEAEEGDAEAGDKEESADEKDSKAKKEEEAIQKAAKTSAAVFKNVVSDAIEPGADEFNKALFGSRSSELKSESFRIRKQRNRIQENISKYLFKNVNMKQLSRRKNLSLENFYTNEKKLLKINRVINEAKSVDEIINNKFWEENATVDLIVDNAINLTRHFEDLIDIPKLIMNSVAIKFGKQAAEESGENKGAENEYKLKLDEFLQKYSTALKELPDYENYDTSRNVFDASKPDHAATGAFSPGG